MKLCFKYTMLNRKTRMFEVNTDGGILSPYKDNNSDNEHLKSGILN